MKFFKRFRARITTNRAFFLVEQGDYENALTLLKRAVEIDPSCGHAHNEMAFVLGRKLRRLGEAEDAARRAIECDPQNPKFHNSLMGVLTDRMSGLRSRKRVLSAVAERMGELDKVIAKDPSYPPYHLTKAAVLACAGHPQAEWEAEIATDSTRALGRISHVQSMTLRSRRACLASQARRMARDPLGILLVKECLCPSSTRALTSQRRPALCRSAQE